MSFANPTPRQAAAELLLAGAVWGFGFVATQWGLETWSPLGLLLCRFSLALVFGEMLHLIFKFSRHKKERNPRSAWERDFVLGLPAGVLLGSFLMLQTIGLQYTTATKSGFITTLYVIFVPLLNFLIFRKIVSVKFLILVLSACCGAYLLMDTSLEGLNPGDLWTLASAVIAAGHIIYIGRISNKTADPFRLNNFQAFWALLTIAPAAFFQPEIQHSVLNMKALWGVILLATAGSVLGFFIQVRSQKVLSDTTASMLFLLESPFAFFFAFFLVGDRLSPLQLIGALVILGAALMTVRLEQNGSTSKTRSE